MCLVIHCVPRRKVVPHRAPGEPPISGPERVRLVQPTFAVRKSRIAAPISRAWVSSANWPVSKKRMSAFGDLDEAERAAAG